MKIEAILKKIRENRDREFNSIPVGFGKGKKILPGIVRGERLGITGSAKVGKSKFAIQFYGINALRKVQAINNPKRLDLKIFWVTIQRSELALKSMIISHLLYIDHGIKIDQREIFSIYEGKKIKQSTVDLIESYKDFLDYFDQHVTIITDKRPSEIKKVVNGWLLTHASASGDTYVDDDGVKHTIYEFHNEATFVEIIIDPLTKIVADFDPNTREPIDAHKSIRVLMEQLELWSNEYGIFTLCVQGQVADKERVEADYQGKTKEEKVEPSLDGLAVNKQIGDMYTTLISLFNPKTYNIEIYRDYDVNKLLGNYISVKVLASDFGSRNVRLPLYFEGASGTFVEMPKAGNPLEPVEGELITDEDYKEFIREQKSKHKSDG